MSVLHLSISDEIMRRIAEHAERLHITPELVAQTALETVYGPAPLEIQEEIEADPDLKAMLQRSEKDIQAGRIHNQQEVREWHRNHPE